MAKLQLSERDICTKRITPALVNAGWDSQGQFREEVSLTNGRVIVRGKKTRRDIARRADYVLYYKPNIPIAVIEAKGPQSSLGDGMQQALGYAELLDVPFAFSSNGEGFLEHDRSAVSNKCERKLSLQEFPSPDALWARYCAARNLTETQIPIITQDYYTDGSQRGPRYYQAVAINRVTQAIAQGQPRILLVMATGTGKTYTAFQIIWRLWKAGAKKRILFLVDRNILANQTMVGDFKPFKSAMCKLSATNNSIETGDGKIIKLTSGVTQDRQVDKSYEIYLSLYQAVTGLDESRDIYKQFSPDFFDLVVIDECHRGSAAADASWRQVLEYFSSATQIGLTATPKETKDVSNIDYFGEPVYTYSLKQGIEDGFLAPYKVVRIGLDKDLDGWRPESGKRDRDGNLIEDREYNISDYDRELVLTQRTETVAAKITEFLKATNRFHKTIVFCENIPHAERMREALVNVNADLAAANRMYIMRITGDNDEGKKQLDNFIDPEMTYPVIATTSKLMTTGVDAQTCHLIVLDQTINSMTEFKQIIGRGTRINEDYNKLYFTIMDFKQATRLFADKDFDGEPVQVYEPGDDDPPVPPDDDPPPDGEADETDTDQLPEDGETITTTDFTGDDSDTTGETATVKRYIVDDVPVAVALERVQYLDEGGKLITESLTDYTRKSIRKSFATLDNFLDKWVTTHRKQAIIDELANTGIFFDELAQQVGTDYDAFDLICHVAYDQKPLTRRERANNVQKQNVFAKYGDAARAVLDALLEKYADSGIPTLESFDTLKIAPLSKLGTPVEIVTLFGGKQGYLDALHELETALYPNPQDATATA